jgi:hypothetical protein
MRSTASFVAGLVAVVAALVTVPLLWLSANVVDQDGYVAFSAELATDDELQVAFADYLADDLVARGILPQQLQETAGTALGLAAQTTASQPGFLQAWGETQRSLHTSAFEDTNGPITVEISPIASFLAQRVGDRLPVTLSIPSDLRAPVASEQDRSDIAPLERAGTGGLVALLVAVVAAAISFFSARSRPLALAGLGLGALVVAGVLRFGTSAVTPQVLDRAPDQSGFARTLQELLVDRAADSLGGWLAAIAVCGGVVLVLGLAGRALMGRPS